MRNQQQRPPQTRKQESGRIVLIRDGQLIPRTDRPRRPPLALDTGHLSLVVSLVRGGDPVELGAGDKCGGGRGE